MNYKVMDRDITSTSSTKTGSGYVVVPKRIVEAMDLTGKVEIFHIEIDGEQALLVKKFVP